MRADNVEHENRWYTEKVNEIAAESDRRLNKVTKPREYSHASNFVKPHLGTVLLWA